MPYKTASIITGLFYNFAYCKDEGTQINTYQTELSNQNLAPNFLSEIMAQNVCAIITPKSKSQNQFLTLTKFLRT